MEKGELGSPTDVLAPVSDVHGPVAIPELDFPAAEGPFDPTLLGDLHAEDLVLSEDYVGSDRRRVGRWARVRRATFGQRLSLLRIEMMIATVVAAVVVALLVLPAPSAKPPAESAVRSAGATAGTVSSHRTASTPTTGSASRPAAPATTPPSSTTATTAAPAAAAPPAATTPATTPPTTPPTTAPPADPTPQQLGAEALTLVRYPWQSIPGYSIQFLPISDAPSSGFYGNTDFTWGQTGGTSTLYVFSGETVQQLAGIIAFEIAHEVDAAAVDPQGGHTQIENIIGLHPASWAPDCDCAEQGYLSGWYAAAFSNYWSPGVGQWATIAPEPSGSELAAVAPWLDPSIP